MRKAMANEPIAFQLDAQAIAKICELAMQTMNGPERLTRELACEDGKILSLEKRGGSLRIGARRFDSLNEAFAEPTKN
jgi:hypothetical protein